MFSTEHRMRCKDGSYKWVHDRGKISSRTPDGKPLRFLSFQADITTRKRADQDLRERETALAQFKSILDQTLDCVFMFHPNTLRFTYCNHGACEQVGYSQAELFAMTPLDIKPDFTLDRFRAMVQPLIDGTWTSLNFETLHRHKDGHDIPVEIVLQLGPVNTTESVYAILRIWSSPTPSIGRLSRVCQRHAAT